RHVTRQSSLFRPSASTGRPCQGADLAPLSFVLAPQVRRLLFTSSASQALISDWYGISRLLASILIRSSSVSGNRSEMVLVEGFSFGNDAGLAWLQSEA